MPLEQRQSKILITQGEEYFQKRAKRENRKSGKKKKENDKKEGKI